MVARKSRRDILTGVGTVGVAGLAGCLGGRYTDRREVNGKNESSKRAPDTVRAAFVYYSDIGDFGWLWSHDLGRRAVDSRFDWVETRMFTDVDPENSAASFRQYAERDFDIIFGATFDYMEPMHEVAAEYPETRFEHCSGVMQRENMGRYFGRMYQARYLAGVAAGLVTDENRLGYVAAFPISEVLRGINAFAHGAASVNDTVTTTVKWTNAWGDEQKEKQAAKQLVSEGVDVLAQHQDSPVPVEVARQAEIWASGYHSPMNEFGGDSYLTSPIWNWDGYYKQTLREVHEETWDADFYWKGLESGIVGLSDWGPTVPDDVRATVKDRHTRIVNGDLDIWAGTQFAGWSDQKLFGSVSSYVDSVEGEAPSL